AFGNRALQVLRRAEAERAGIADVELDQLAAAGLQFAGAAGELAADLVTHGGQALAGLQGQHRGVLAKGSPILWGVAWAVWRGGCGRIAPGAACAPSAGHGRPGARIPPG